MMNRKLKVYAASGWFTNRTREILDYVERVLTDDERIDVYSPRRDGVMLPPNQKHDTALRESVFKDNLKHIHEADVIFANIDSFDSYNDPGTVYEIGYAMSIKKPVIGFTESMDNLNERFGSILSGLDRIVTVDDLELDYIVSNYTPNKILFVGAGNDNVDKKLASHIIDNGGNLRWLENAHTGLYDQIDDIFKGVEYMIAVIDDRKTPVSWMIGQAYARNIPVITYSDYNYGINLMLLVSVLTHLQGVDALDKFLQQVKRSGLKSIPKMDISDINAM